MPLQGKIDVDRGVHMKQIVKFDEKNPNSFTPDNKYGGLMVYMYVDEPGLYYDVHGKNVAEGMAALAGFDVNKFAKARKRREALAAYDKRLEQELSLEKDEEVILAEAGDWRVIALPLQRARVIDIETGEAVTAAPMTQADALELLKHLVGTGDEAEAAAKSEPAPTVPKK